MNELNKYYVLVEQAISMAGIEPALCRTAEEGQWSFGTGNIEIWVDLWYIESEDRTYFQVMSPIGMIPAEGREDFYRELLDLNYQMIDVNFVSYKDGIYIKSIREVNFLTPEAMSLTINRVGYYGLLHEKHIIQKYKLAKIEYQEEPGA